MLESRKKRNKIVLPEYICKITNTHFRPATEEELAELEYQVSSGALPGKDNIKAQTNIKCLKCDKRHANAMFMGCGHGGLCFKCAKKRNMRQKECHLCSKKIKAVLAMDIENSKGKLYKIVESIINREQ